MSDSAQGGGEIEKIEDGERLSPVIVIDYGSLVATHLDPCRDGGGVVECTFLACTKKLPCRG